MKSTKRKIFEDIEEILLDSGIVKYVDQFNNQIELMDEKNSKQHPLPFPNALLQYSGIDYVDNTLGLQTASGNIIVFISDWHLEHQKYQIYDLVEEVNEKIHTLKDKDDYYSSIVRVGEDSLDNFNGVITYIVNYRVEFVENSGSKRKDWNEKPKDTITPKFTTDFDEQY